MYGKVKLADLMKGAGWDWMKTGQKIIADQQLADMRKPDIQMSTRTRGGGQRKAGIGEGELATIEAQPEGDVYKPKDLLNSGDKEAREKKAMKMAEGRTDGVLPEQADASTPINRGERSKVDADNATDEKLVNSTANAIQADKAGNGIGGYDDIMAIMRANTLNEGDMARRQHSREIVTGLGDLVSSIANLWATTKGAPNSYDNSKGMTATSQSRYDRELARRKAQNEQILNYYRVKKAAEDDAETKEYRRQMLAVRQQEADRRQAESDAKIKREDDVAQARANLYKAQESKANADTVKKKGENQYAVTYWEKYSQYRLTSSHEEADRLANIDAAAAEQKYLDEENARKNKAANKKSGSSGSNKSKTNKKKSKDKLYGSKPRLY